MISYVTPLNGLEIRRGIVMRMTEGLPPDILEEIKNRITEKLSHTCLLLESCAYAKFSAEWDLAWWKEDDGIRFNWWASYALDDFGMVSKGRMGEESEGNRSQPMQILHGVIQEMPPDRFRRETGQTIPKKVEREIKKESALGLSRSRRFNARQAGV